MLSILKDSGVNVTDTSTGFTYSGRTYKRLDLDDALRLGYQRRNTPVPPPNTAVTYTSADIGGARTAGSTTMVTAGKAYDLATSGVDVWNSSDQFRFLYRTVTGDFDARVRLQSLSAADAWSKAGLMVRESLAPSARNLFAFATPSSNGARFSYRPLASGATIIAPAKLAVNYPNKCIHRVLQRRWRNVDRSRQHNPDAQFHALPGLGSDEPQRLAGRDGAVS